jgi:hypothetical protein
VHLVVVGGGVSPSLPAAPLWVPIYHNGPNYHLVCCDVAAAFFGAVMHVVILDNVCKVR